jgi:anti-sigma B factor antagonist
MSTQTYEHFDVRTAPDLTEVSFVAKQLDNANIQEIGDQLYQLVEQQRPGRLRLDFGSVEYISSMVLGKLLGLHRRVRANRGQLTIDNVAPQVYEVFEVTSLTHFLDVHAKAEA